MYTLNVQKKGRITMKRLVLLATILAFVLGMASMASAATIKASGQWALEFLFSENFDMTNENDSADSNGDFNVYQRARTQFDFIANENLKGVLATEIGTTRWGEGNAGAAGFHFRDHSTPINVRRAYLDFMVPDTKVAVRGGLQGIALPNSGAFNNSNIILDDEMPALVVSTPIIDEVSVLAGYGRLYDEDTTIGISGHTNGSLDTGFLALPVTLDGFAFAPYFVYAYAGHDAYTSMNVGNPGANDIIAGLLTKNPDLTTGRRAYWGGTSFTMTYFDPIKVMADVAYGNVNGGGDANNRSGWMFDLAVDYTGFDYMTPEVFFAYTSGEDDNVNNGSERMPVIKTRNWAAGSFWFGGDTLLSGNNGYVNTEMGFWALGLSLKDISFIENLSHTVTGMYVQGTNDKNTAGQTIGETNLDFVSYGHSLTEKDHIIEFDLNNSYQLYDELTLSLDLGYIVNGYDKDTWGSINREDAFKLSTGLSYNF
jgi:hypothetical protein